ncbi:MAG: Tol-Pal system beta propeller repeat protein TolB [Rhodospirillaceae bacterium]|jgi:TolB protein|nr:Tol-Pal system beta propeller repeat protein TolB [Rhodospirillaceae bacterium]
MKRRAGYSLSNVVRAAARLFVGVCLIAAFWHGVAFAELRVDITRGSVRPMPIAVTDFIGADAPARDLGRDIAAVVKSDLEMSGLFKPVDPKAFIAVEKSLDTVPHFQNWSVLNADALAQGLVTLAAGNRMHVKFRLWDVAPQKQIIGQKYTTLTSNWRRIAHIIADAIYKRVTGENGYFDTRIVYIAEQGPEDRREKRLAIMDWDGANHHFLTDGKDLVLTPRFSPSRQEITYMSYYRNVPRVYIFNIETGRQEMLGDFPGMTFSPRFSPDGNRVIMSMAKDGNTEIYTMDLRTRAVKRLTRHSAIDTSPYYSPDAKKIVFNSDRSGAQQLYLMNADGSSVRRISFGKGRYATPVWSPRGDLIAFTKISGGRFFIGVMAPDGGGERLLADGFLVEAPTWSPNGRVLMFFRETPLAKKGGKRTRLYSIDLTGQNERQIVTPMDASDPAWSPLIP